jgi:hypothetical protein
MRNPPTCCGTPCPQHGYNIGTKNCSNCRRRRVVKNYVHGTAALYVVKNNGPADIVACMRALLSEHRKGKP